MAREVKPCVDGTTNHVYDLKEGKSSDPGTECKRGCGYSTNPKKQALGAKAPTLFRGVFIIGIFFGLQTECPTLIIRGGEKPKYRRSENDC